MHEQIGKNKLEWYGSGDVNNDEVINQADLDAMNSMSNDRSDGDGNSSTSNDKAVLHDYLNSGRNYLPGHWNSLTTKVERVDWLEKMIQIADVHSHDVSGWFCRNFIHQLEIDFYGISNIAQFIQEQKNGGEITYDKTNNAKLIFPYNIFQLLILLVHLMRLVELLLGKTP